MNQRPSLLIGLIHHRPDDSASIVERRLIIRVGRRIGLRCSDPDRLGRGNPLRGQCIQEIGIDAPGLAKGRC
jgi:hypothetical protein